VNTKICPNCNADVPGVANLCKHCFHDFNMVIVKQKSPLFTILFLLLGMSIVSAIAFGYMHGAHKSSRISVDEETKSIVFTTKYADRTEADRIYFKDITTIEYVKNARPRPFEVAVVTTKGDRYVYKQSVDPLDYQALQLSEVIGKPISEKDNYEAPAVIRKP